jgi:hypothetical protein
MRKLFLLTIIAAAMPLSAQFAGNGLGASTMTCVDRDGDGYGTGPGCLGPDADDLDISIHTGPQAVTKYGTLPLFLAHLGYNPLRIWYIATTGNDSTCISGSAPVGIGSPCLTSAPPLANLVAGDMVIYRSGTYLESGRFNPDNLGTNGTDHNPIIAMAYPGESATIDTSATLSTDISITDSSYITIDGLKLTKGQNNGCIEGGSTNSIASSNAFHDIIIRHVEASFCFWGIIAIGADNILIEDSTWHDNNTNGGQHGVYLGTRGTEVSLNNVIRRNLFFNNAWNGIHANGAMSAMVMEQNISYGNGIANYDWQNGPINSIFRSNVSIAPGQSGALVLSVYDGNEGLTGCGSGGTSTCVCNPANAGAICAHDMTGNTFENFTTYGTATSFAGGSAVNIPSITVAQQSSCTTAWCLGRNLGSNTFRNIIAVANTDGSGAYMPIVYPQLGTGWPQSSTFDHMVLWDNDSAHMANVFGYGPGSSFGYQGYTCSSPPSGVTLSSCTNADPKFLNASPAYTPYSSLWNLNLQGSSPALATGTTTGVPTFDTYGNPFGATPSMGAINPSVGKSGWVDLTNTQVSSVCPPNNYMGIAYNFPAFCSSIMSAWSGATIDSKRNHMIIAGGGHSDYYGNDIYSVDLGGSTPSVSRIRDPDDFLLTFTPGTMPCVPFDALANGAPSPRHSYNGLAFNPVKDFILYQGQGPSPCGQNPTNMFTIDTSATPPTYLGMDPENGYYPLISAGVTPTSDYWPMTKLIYLLVNNTLVTYDNPTSNTYTLLGSANSYNTWTNTTGRIDLSSGKYWFLGDTFGALGVLKMTYIDLTQSPPTLTDVTSSAVGCSAMGISFPGLVYNPVTQTLWGYPGSGNTAYELNASNPAVPVCIAHTFSGGPPTASGAQGMFGRWNYSPANASFVAANVTTQDVYELTPTPAAGPAPPQSTAIMGGAATGGGKAVFNPSMAPFDVAINTTNTQASVAYTPPAGFSGTCSIQVADMSRSINVATGSQSGTTVTINTVSPHGLLSGAIIWMENTGVALWNGWQTVTVVTTTRFTFTAAASGSSTSTAGDAGVLIDDVNPGLFTSGNLDTRPGNITISTKRTFVVGLRQAPMALDNTRHTRTLQANTRHHMDLTCGSVVVDQEFTTANIPLGSTYNDSAPQPDNAVPGQFSLPTLQWPVQAQTLIDPTTGIRAYRATGPMNALSAAANFVSAFTPGGGWSNASVPPSTASPATFSGTGGSLFLRADNFTLSGGASYASPNTGLSLDSLTVTTQASCVSGSCSVAACLTINGVSCASTALPAKTLTGSSASYTFGTQGIMDLWQSLGPPMIQVPFSRADAALASGTVNFTLSTEIVVLASGNKFSPNWVAGSVIVIAGTPYSIASVQGPTQLTLSSGPGSNLTGAAYTAPNFGVILTCTGLCSIGTTQYVVGSSAQQPWPADAKNASSPPVLRDGTSGPSGYSTFIGSELYWIAQDGSQTIDEGAAFLLFNGTSILARQVGGTSNGYYNFDPDGTNYPDTWYVIAGTFGDPTRVSFVKVQYNTTGTSNPIHSAHIAGAPGVDIPNCTSVSFPIPCLLVTIMQPLAAQTISQGGTTFNSDYAASGFTPGFWFYGGASPEGQLMAYAYGVGQDTPGWWFIYSLGNRQPAGVAGGLTEIASASTYRKAPASWCTIHDMVTPAGGWIKVLNNGTYLGAQGAYSMTLASGNLASSGAIACPANPFGATGNNCDTITVSGQPVSTGSPPTIQNIQQGDLIIFNPTTGGEVVRVITVPTGGGLTFTVSRAAGGTTGVAHTTGATTTMTCGTLNLTDTGFYSLTNFVADPLGANATWTTVVNDPLGGTGHSYISGGIPNPSVTVAGQNAANFTPAALCPSASNLACQQVRNGYVLPDSSSQRAIALNPPFGGIKGIGDPNGVDSHPGACLLGFCMDFRPLNGAGTLTFTLISGKVDLWKATGTTLNRKFLPTFAYVGRRPLVDVSGPTSTIVDGATDYWQYCSVNVTGECVAGSSVGDVYVNAPFVGTGTCPYPGVAVDPADFAAICVDATGAYTGNLTQWAYSGSDLTGSAQRRLGENFNQWNQYSVFAASQLVPSGLVLTTNVPFLNGVRTDDLIDLLPPFPQQDGVNRTTFLPESVTTTAPTGLSVTQAYVEFGYAENGPATSYWCTSRGETCVADAASVGATPFWYEISEAGSIAPIACSTSCTIAIPALSERALYYRWQYLNSGGSVVSTGPQQVIVTQ